jgi:hypothetical protein
MDNYNSQSGQDKFILQILQNKYNGYFLEIGSNDPITINNTYLLENKYNWKGIMVEYEPSYLQSYQNKRPNSIHVMNDATKVDYKNLFITNNVPTNIDYLQIDLEVANGSTLQTLQKLEDEVFDMYKFAVITFEHDIYHSNFENTRIKSKEIFNKRGYYCVFDDINNGGNPYEDWYVHPELVDMDFVKRLQLKNKHKYQKYINEFLSQEIDTINYLSIEY